MSGARFWGVAAGMLGALSVALGAFGAHALRDRLTVESMAIFKTAVDYQFLHSLALLSLAVWMRFRPSPTLHLAALAFFAGIVVFCGSLYLLVATQSRMWGAVTPVGGVAFLIGWVLVIVTAWREQ